MTTPEVKLAILDDYFELARQHFAHLSGVDIDVFTDTINPATDDGLERLAQRLRPYQIISTMRERTPFQEALLSRLPNLKLLLTTGMRNASLDLDTAAEKGIVITGAKGAGRSGGRRQSVTERGAPIARPPPVYQDSTTQHIWALLLSLCGRIPQDDLALKTSPHAWQSGLAVALGGMTLGLAGLGRLGATTARIATLAFGMKVIAWSENLTQERADGAAESVGLPKGTYRAVSKEDLFRESDVVSLHLVLSDRTRGVISTNELAMMKPTALLLNTSRGPLIDEQALLGALEVGAIKGFATDVYWIEPLPADSPWRSANWGKDGRSEVVLSPHMGYVNEGVMHAWYDEQADIVESWLNGAEVENRLN